MRFALILFTVILFNPLSAFADDKTDVIKALELLHKAEREGNADGIRDAFSTDGVFLGTDATEAWSMEKLHKDLSAGFKERGGWTFEIKERTIGISPDGNTAWFKEIAHYVQSNFTLRPTGTMLKQDGKWKITQLHMGVPIPNDIFGAFQQSLQAYESDPELEKAAIAGTLDKLHKYASEAKGKEYFDLFMPDGVFIGTDITERWPIPAFKEYAMERFNTGVGWTYQAVTRTIDITPSGTTAYFDENLDSQSYGVARGSGVLVRVDGNWKIAQYHLTYPIPNELSKKFTDEIKALAASKK